MNKKSGMVHCLC